MGERERDDSEDNDKQKGDKNGPKITKQAGQDIFRCSEFISNPEAKGRFS